MLSSPHIVAMQGKIIAIFSKMNKISKDHKDSLIIIVFRLHQTLFLSWSFQFLDIGDVRFLFTLVECSVTILPSRRTSATADPFTRTVIVVKFDTVNKLFSKRTLELSTSLCKIPNNTPLSWWTNVLLVLATQWSRGMMWRCSGECSRRRAE